MEGLREAAAGAHAGLAGVDEDGGGAISALGAAEMLLQGRAGRPWARLTHRTGERRGGELGDLAGELRDYLDGIDADPGRLAALEERLEAIDRLKRKHGGSVESVLAHAEHCRAIIEDLENAEERGTEAETALHEAEARRVELGAALSKGRARAAGPFQKQVAAG